MDHFQSRRDKLCRAVKRMGADALLVTNFTNVTYLSGFSGDDSYLLIGREGAVMLSDPRYTTQLGEECPGLDLEIRPPGTSMLATIAKRIGSARIGKLAIEGDSMTVSLRDRIAEELPKTAVVASSGLVEKLRQIKDKEEIERICQAVRYAEKAFAVIRASLMPDMTEKEVSDQLANQLRMFGAAGCSFPSVVASGPRAALPHATVTDQRIGSSDFVLIDWGADEGLYKSDLTRVLVTGKILPKLKRIYEVVLRAQREAIGAVRPGALAHDVDCVARTIISDAGFGRNFGHGLGHGLGLNVHESPRLGTDSKVLLKPGMVVTVEPGIYLPGWGGVRIEDDVLVTRTGHRILSNVPKDFDEVIVH